MYTNAAEILKKEKKKKQARLMKLHNLKWSAYDKNYKMIQEIGCIYMS